MTMFHHLFLRQFIGLACVISKGPFYSVIEQLITHPKALPTITYLHFRCDDQIEEEEALDIGWM
jgi:hypothetical protein